MFSGIVQGKGRIASLHTKEGGIHYGVKVDAKWKEGISLGASVAINGVCQTVVKIKDEELFFDAIPETLRVSNLATLHIDGEVNIERALRWGEEVGGHLLSGHISETALIHSIIKKGIVWEVTIQPSSTKYLMPKGYVALDGVSLTVMDIQEERFLVHLIPETRLVTIWGNRNEGERVNIEWDSQAQTIVNTVERYLSLHTNVTSLKQ